MYYIESSSTDPYLNLALEQYVFDCMDQESDYCMLWQNDNAVVVGKHQNTFAEIDRTYVDEHSVKVARRLSGGGAVYHDLGNVNFTFISRDNSRDNFDFATFCRPVIKALGSLGVKAQLNGRNDISIEGKKFSGNSQYMKRDRVMHHGTIMFDSDLDVVQKVLNVPKDKLESKGFKSVKSRVTNVRPYLKHDLTTQEFIKILREFLHQEYGLRPYHLPEAGWNEVQKLRDNVYARWKWNYGESPRFSIVKERRVENCGKIQVHMDVADGIITRIAFYGDYFGNGDSSEVAKRLCGRRLEEHVLEKALQGANLGHYFSQMDIRTFLNILLK